MWCYQNKKQSCKCKFKNTPTTSLCTVTNTAALSFGMWQASSCINAVPSCSVRSSMLSTAVRLDSVSSCEASSNVSLENSLASPVRCHPNQIATQNSPIVKQRRHNTLNRLHNATDQHIHLTILFPLNPSPHTFHAHNLLSLT